MVRFYSHLWKISEQVRYIAGHAFTMNSSAVEENLRKKYHFAIEQWSAKIVAQPVEVEVKAQTIRQASPSSIK